MLYDVSTLYFETDRGDGFREPGFSKERRLEPQITIGLLTGQDGFPLMVSAFEGNRAETKTMLPVIEKFMAAHSLPDVTVIADAGMISEANQKAIEAAGRAAERDAIKAAMDRLLNGTPAVSTGALSVLQLAAEAGVKRWVLTHKHPDLKAEFERRRTASNGVPAAFQNLHARVTDLEDACRRLRAGKAELSERVQVYAQVIHELTTELSRLRQQSASQGSIIPLTRHPQVR